MTTNPRRGSSRRVAFRTVLALATALAALTTMAFGGPATAASDPGHGSAVVCRYHTNSPGPAFNAQFRRIMVTPPQLLAKNGGRQKIGWSFSVSRGIGQYSDPPTSWTVTYTSSVQKAYATTIRYAGFGTRWVTVSVPGGITAKKNTYYHVTLDMYWYRANGSVQVHRTYQLPNYNLFVNGSPYDYTDACPGLVWAAV
jgi:hypothetical protein